MNGLDRSLLAIFSTEQAEHLASIRTEIEKLQSEEAGTRTAGIENLLRRLHTLKGAARAVGLEPTERLTHQAEEVLTRLRKGEIDSFDAVARTLPRTADAIEDILAAATLDRSVPDWSDLLSQLEQLSGSTSRVVATQPPLTAAPETDLPAQLAPELLRVQARSIDELIRSTSDLLIDTTGGGGLSRFEEYVSRLEETATEWARLRRAALASVRTLGDNPDFRPAAACLTFVDTHLTSLRRDARRLSENLSQSVRSTKSKTDVVYQAACRIRMTPAESVFSSFGPMVRDLARQEGREVLFETAGLDINADLSGVARPERSGHAPASECSFSWH